MARGGRREGSGRKIKAAPPLTQGVARELFDDPKTKTAWEGFREANDQWLRFSAEKFIWEQAEGKAVQRISHGVDKPIDINVTIRRVGAKP
jgi:hypothetical protein